MELGETALSSPPCTPRPENCIVLLRGRPFACVACVIYHFSQYAEPFFYGERTGRCRRYCLIAVCARVINVDGSHFFCACVGAPPLLRWVVDGPACLSCGHQIGRSFYCVTTVCVRAFCARPVHFAVCVWECSGGDQLVVEDVVGRTGEVEVLISRSFARSLPPSCPSPPPLPLFNRRRSVEIHSQFAHPRGWTHFEMFAHAHVPLVGTEFRARFDGLPTQAKSNYEQLDTFAQLLSPLKWEDQLSSSQRLRLHVVTTHAEWNAVVDSFRLALQKVPVLSLAAVMEDGELRYVAFAVHDVHVAVLSLGALKKVQVNWFRWADLLPAELKEWLSDPDVFVLMAEDPTVLADMLGSEIHNVVITSQVYMKYQSRGVVHPAVPTADGDLSKQMAYCFGYTHRPCTPEVFRHLCGHHQYRVWPEHRQPGWRPVSTFDLKVREEFFLFFEAAGPMAFVYHLLRHGTVFGDLAEVSPTLPFAQFLVEFLQELNRPDASPSDPLGLVADIACAAREEGETLELTDRRLEDEFRSESGVGPPPDHPGYFTTGGSRGTTSLPVDSAAQEVAPPGDGGDVEPMEQAGSAELAAGVSGKQTESAVPTGGGVDPEGAAAGSAPPLRGTSRERPSRERSGGWSPRRKRHASVPLPPRPPPWYSAAVEAASRPAPWAIDLRSQLTLPSNNNNQQTLAKLTAVIAAAQSYPGVTAATDVSASFSYDSPQDLRARLDVRRGLAALGAEAQGPERAVDLPVDYNLCFATRTLRAARRGDAAATGGEFAPPEEEGDEEGGFPALERNPPNLYLTHAERAYNPFAQQPVFHGRCEFCSGNHCSRRNRAGTGPNCKKLRQHARYTPTRRLCLYRRCGIG